MCLIFLKKHIKHIYFNSTVHKIFQVLYLDWPPGKDDGRVKNTHNCMNDAFKEQITKTNPILSTTKVTVIEIFLEFLTLPLENGFHNVLLTHLALCSHWSQVREMDKTSEQPEHFNLQLFYGSMHFPSFKEPCSLDLCTICQ